MDDNKNKEEAIKTPFVIPVRKKRYWWTGVLILGCCILCSSWFIGAENYDVRMSSDKLIYSKNINEITLIGNVKFTYKDVVLSGDKAVFNTEKQEGKMTGRVKITQPGTIVTGDIMNVYYKSKTAILTGDVKLVSSKNPYEGGKNGREKEEDVGITTLTAGELSYNWLTMQGDAKGKVTAEQKDRRVFADTARYDGSVGLITLEKNVRFEQGAGNWLTADSAYMDLRKETFIASGGVRGNFLVEGEEEEDKDKKTPSPSVEKTPDKIQLPSVDFMP